jgi:hypothetical protein
MRYIMNLRLRFANKTASLILAEQHTSQLHFTGQGKSGVSG